MPSNVSVEYDVARLKYEEAKSPEAKLATLLEMQRLAPSHKGAEKLRKHISGKIASVRMEMDKRKQQDKKSGGGKNVSVPKEGIGQVALVGLPNSGKSTMLKKLTGVDVAIAPYKFTTTKPEIGMMDFHNGKVQLVELPAIVEGSSAGKFNGPQVLAIARNANAIIIVASSEKDEKIIVEELKNAGIILNKRRPKIRISTGNYKGISISGKKFLKCKEEEFVKFLKGAGVFNTSIVLNEPTDLELLSQSLNVSVTYKKSETVNPFKELSEEKIPKLKEKIFNLLEVVLVYTKKPGQEVEKENPLSLPKGTTVEEAAKSLHKDFTKMKYAKLWGSSKYEGQRVPKEYKLQNFDVLEIYS